MVFILKSTVSAVRHMIIMKLDMFNGSQELCCEIGYTDVLKMRWLGAVKGCHILRKAKKHSLLDFKGCKCVYMLVTLAL